MKTICIFVIYTLSVIVEGTWWTAAMRPIILSFGAAFSSFNLDELTFLDYDLKGLLVSKNDSDEKFKGDNRPVDKEKMKKELEKLKKIFKETEASPEHFLDQADDVLKNIDFEGLNFLEDLVDKGLEEDKEKQLKGLNPKDREHAIKKWNAEEKFV